MKYSSLNNMQNLLCVRCLQRRVCANLRIVERTYSINSIENYRRTASRIYIRVENFRQNWVKLFAFFYVIPSFWSYWKCNLYENDSGSGQNLLFSKIFNISLKKGYTIQNYIIRIVEFVYAMVVCISVCLVNGIEELPTILDINYLKKEIFQFLESYFKILEIKWFELKYIVVWMENIVQIGICFGRYRYNEW